MSSKEQIKIKRGDVYAVSTAIGYAFFQVAGSKYAPEIYVIRVLQTVLPSINGFHASIVCEKERYYTMMAAGEALRLKLITLVGTYPIPFRSRVPLKYRRLEYIPHKNIRRWYEICLIGSVTIYEKRVAKLTDKFLTLSGHGIWNIAYLRERIEENWSLKDWR